MSNKAARIITVGLMLSAQVFADGLINGDFEANNLSGWNVSRTGHGTYQSEAAAVGGTTSNSLVGWLYSGADGSIYGTSGDSQVSLSQTFYALAGQQLRFDYFTYCTDSAGAFRSFTNQYTCAAQALLSFNEVVVWSMSLPVDPSGNLLDWGTVFTDVFEQSGDYTISFVLETWAQYSIPLEAPAAVSLSAELDNVQVIPEPSSVLLMAIGAIAIIVRRHLSC